MCVVVVQEAMWWVVEWWGLCGGVCDVRWSGECEVCVVVVQEEVWCVVCGGVCWSGVCGGV